MVGSVSYGTPREATPGSEGAQPAGPGHQGQGHTGPHPSARDRCGSGCTIAGGRKARQGPRRAGDGAARMTRLRRIAVATASALPLVVVLSQALPQWRDDPAKLRECISLANGIILSDLTIEPHELRQELVERGVTLPLPPSLAFTPRDSRGEAEALLRQYESAKAAYETKWEDI